MGAEVSPSEVRNFEAMHPNGFRARSRTRYVPARSKGTFASAGVSLSQRNVYENTAKSSATSSPALECVGPASRVTPTPCLAKGAASAVATA